MYNICSEPGVQDCITKFDVLVEVWILLKERDLTDETKYLGIVTLSTAKQRV